MKLSIIDRVIILTGLFPSTSTVKEISLFSSINGKLVFTKEESERVQIVSQSDGTANIQVKDIKAYDRVKDFDLSEEELIVLKQYADLADRNRMVTQFSLSTIVYLQSIKTNEADLQ